MAFGNQIEWLQDVSSTMDVMAERAKAGAPEGLVVIAERQTKGRGRHGREWASPAGGMWLSILLRPQIPISSLGMLPIALGVAAAETVSEVARLPIGLKWPNDVLVNGRKLGGLLIETRLCEARIEYALFGIGLNINIPKEQLPELVRTPATSILIETGKMYDMHAFIEKFLVIADRYYHCVKNDDCREVCQKWNERDAMKGRLLRATFDGEILEGKNCGIDSCGALVVETLRGMHVITSGEIEWI